MIGQHFGNYVATAVIGRGGMGTVYLALHPGIGREVAIKVLRPELGADQQLLTRFLNEARAANAIRHPNIIEILDSGTTEAGVSYLVMELLEGEPLVTRMQRLGWLQPPDALEIARQIASALGAAHAKKIVHRDLKPDNLFLIPSPEPTNPTRERVKVLDFGIAKLQPTIRGDSLRTRTGMLMGTPIYMSPEQCLGTRDVDHRTDIYALGVILFEMLTSRPPFVSEGFGDLVNMHINKPPPVPSSLRPGLPPALDALVARMLAKRPEDRVASMGELEPQLIALRGRVTTLRDAGGMAATAALRNPPRGSTTLSTTSGERNPPVAATTQVARRARFPVVFGTLGLLVVIAAGTLLAVRRRGSATPTGASSQPAPTPMSGTPASVDPRPAAAAKPTDPEPPVTLVRVRVSSTPAGARIVRVADGAVIGITPTLLELRVAPQPLAVRIEKDGYVPTTRDLSLDHDSDTAIPLTAAPQVRPHRARPPAVEEPAKL
jgi:serine/threonine protein kinase